MFTPFFMYFLEKVDSPSLTVRYTNSMTGNSLFARYLNYCFFFAGKNENTKDSNSTGTAVYDRGVSNHKHERLKSWL